MTADLMPKSGNGYTYSTHHSPSGIPLVEVSYLQRVVTITSGAKVTAQVERHSGLKTKFVDSFIKARCIGHYQMRHITAL